MGIVRYIRNQFKHDRNTRSILNNQYSELQRINELLTNQRIREYREKTLNSTEAGVSDNKLCDKNVVVSLTSFGSRIYDVHLAIESIMQGTVKPNSIILWLSEEEFKGKTLPKTLELQMKRGLHVEYTKDIRAYTKLIPSLMKYPEDCIITIDDDAIYEYDIVERLVASYQKNPDAISACRIHKVILDENNKPVSYLDWEWGVREIANDSPLYFPTGVGGVLYPPHCFSKEVFNQQVFMEKCPFADDVWFYAMRLLNNTPVAQVYTGRPSGYYWELPSSSINALSSTNTDVNKCENDYQLEVLFDYYDLYNKLIS